MNPPTVRPELEGEEGEWQGPRPLYMAGLYSTWTGDGCQVLHCQLATAMELKMSPGCTPSPS